MIKEISDVISVIKDGGNMQDFADKINSVITVIILLSMTILIASKTYIFLPIECYSINAPRTASGDFGNYVTNFCWVNGTIVLKQYENTPNRIEWYANNRKVINYYPWIPIILAIQCCLFYLPRVIWKEYCTNNTGIDLENIISSSKTACCALSKTKNENIKDISSTIEMLFHLNRNNSEGKIADVKRKIVGKIPVLIWGKQYGNNIFGFYLFIKFLYLINAVGQLFFMCCALQLNNSFWMVFLDVFRYIFYGQDWEATEYFPRITFCMVDGIRVLGAINNVYIAQCVLTINILNEKIYIFLFIWISILVIVTVLYSLNWVYILLFFTPKRRLVMKYLKGRNIFKVIEKPLMETFISEFLRFDGIFLLNMVRMNCGDLFTAYLVEQLFSVYKTKYRFMDFSKADCGVRNENLAFRLERGEPKPVRHKTPSAPKKEIFL